MPGAGGVDWPTLFRTLAQCHYHGPLTVAIDDADVDADYAAAEAVQLVRRLDFPPKPRADERNTKRFFGLSTARIVSEYLARTNGAHK